MRIRILRSEHENWTDALIKAHTGYVLPSLTDGWRFNFSRHSRSRHASTYILIAEETPGTIEGCLIYQLREAVEPYMAYIESAPHNKGKSKRYDRVAGCLIAYACRLSFISGKGDYKGWLAFDVQEEDESDRDKLMAMYSRKYHARRFGDTTMLIMPQDGEQLIEKYLENENI